MANAGHKGMGEKTGVEHVGPTDPHGFDEDDIANEIKGKNSLQGNDQSKVRNQRQAVPGARRETEGVIESFENMDPKHRTEKE